jgi:single-stranded DNA-binding protein
MINAQNENNIVTISGKIAEEPKFSYEVYGESFYYFIIEVPRLSNSSDKIAVTISERLGTLEDLKIGKFVFLNGQFRSYNNYSGEGSKLMLTVFAREIKFSEEELTNKSQNQIYLNGFICKKPIYRTTPFGREIADLLIAVNRHYNKSDYIPCITWGRNAKFSENLKIGDNIKVWGRIQSRDYQKKLENGETISRVAYEISIAKLELSKESETNKNSDNQEEYQSNQEEYNANQSTVEDSEN